MSTRAKLAVIALLSYAIGVILSPFLLPVDFLTTTFIVTPADQTTSDSTTTNNNAAALSSSQQSLLQIENANEIIDELQQLPPLKYEADYKNIIGENDPFHNVNIVLHRNGEPDECASQKTQTQQLLDGMNTTANYNGNVLQNILTRLGMTTSTATSNDEDTPLFTATHNNNPIVLSPLSKSILFSSEQFDKPISFDSKYDLDSLLTHTFAKKKQQQLFPQSSSSCGPTWSEDAAKPHYLDQGQVDLDPFSSLIKYCDMGVHRTPIQPDHGNYVRLPQVSSLPCTFHTREGVRVTSLSQLADLARGVVMETSANNDGDAGKECHVGDNVDSSTCSSTTSSSNNNNELHLYAVSAGRVFMFAPKHVGEIFELPHVKGPRGLPVSLEVMSLQPRVFDIYNFFDRAESAAIVDKALRETSDTHRMKRSSTGASGYNLNSKRTSENGFDTHGSEAQTVKRRCMDILGFDEYIESLTDGLQVLRYNKTTGYFPHYDWIDDHGKKEEHNFDSEGIGSNRFATILLYMSDLGERDGGETLFSNGWPVGQAEEDHVKLNDALEALRASGDVEGLLKEGSWEEQMVANCRSRLAVRPHSSRAVLFYSQHPDGSVDRSSLHGGCPVITDQPKWAANLWAWSAPRSGFPGSPKNMHVVERNRAAIKSTPKNDLQKSAKFINTKTDEKMRHAKLFFQETFWGNYGFDGPPLGVNTFEGHQWHVQVDGKVVKSFVVGKEKNQEFTI